jgi:hypothetical protein
MAQGETCGEPQTWAAKSGVQSWGAMHSSRLLVALQAVSTSVQSDPQAPPPSFFLVSFLCLCLPLCCSCELSAFICYSPFSTSLDVIHNIYVLLMVALVQTFVET